MIEYWENLYANIFKALNLTSEDIDLDRDICHHLYFDPSFCKKAISWQINVSGEVGKASSPAPGSNHLDMKDWLTSGC